MVLCASTPISDVTSRGCCCCCRCPCHETKPNSLAPRCASANPGADLASTHSARRHVDPSEGSGPSQSHSSNSRPSSPGPAMDFCSGCTLKWGEEGARQHHACRCSQCCSCSCSVPPASLLASLVKTHPCLSCLPVVDERTDAERLAEAITKSGYPGSFAWAKESSPCGYARLCRAGFLPVAERFMHPADESYPQLSTTLLLPKLHRERMCLFLNLDKGVTLASKNLRRKSRHFLVSVDRAFDEVLAGCVRRHGENWLWKSVRQSVPLQLPKCLRALHRRTLREAALRRQREGLPEGSSPEAPAPNHHGVQQTVQQSGGEFLCPEDVQLHSFEVWVPLCEIANIKLLPLKTSTAEETDTSNSTDTAHGSEVPATELSEALTSLGSSIRIGEASTQYRDLCLVAGEVGVSIGRVYTSLTAFTDADSAGTAQLTATRLLLRKAGYELLDLGMNLPYKATLGAKPLPREVFLKLFRRLRDRNATPLDATMQQCHESIQAAAKPQYGTSEQSTGQWVGRQDGTSRTASKDIREEPTPPAAENVQRLHLPPGFVRCVDLFRLLEGS